ncbi:MULTISPECIES: AAA family ATPase [unclassified Amycolatopsis]|uniref:ParA family protein n=1 Tax=unclassified Amycolatopsis TaxID=2618356 RepID=UPI0028745910|nr:MULTISPECIES: AAA family ATPase [unclassified Amycolatopsis]MDS0140622.1 ParA family protein [Amycolatopsis sp. 505]MDS0149272.1 ParA family protein [Amycolatopsis sp. CM201R]
MSTVAVVNLAGSAGKTTTATTLAVQLAQQGRKCRIIDFDAQTNTSTWFGIDVGNRPTIADVLLGRATLAEASVKIADVPNLSVVPSTRGGLDRAQVELTRETGSEFRFAEVQRMADDVDHTIIDCPGSYSVLVVSAILATQADEDDEESLGRSGVITCTQPMLKENEGIPVLLAELDKIKRTYRRNVELLAIVPCIVPPDNAGDVYMEQLESVREAFPDIVTPSVRRSVTVAEAYTNSCPIPLFNKAKLVNGDYAAVLASTQKRGVLI